MTEQVGLRTKNSEALALRGVEATARIAGLLANTTLVQHYENATKKNLEVAYTFPLPVDAVLLGFSVSIGERRYDGEVVPRRQAEEKYEKAVESGHSAFRLQEVSKGLYSATLGNVLGAEHVRIELQYAEPLSWNGQSIRYRLPTTLAPRYGKPKMFAPWQAPRTSLDAQYALMVSVELMGELATTSVSSPSHDIRLAAEVGCLTVLVADGASMDRDFILDVRGDQLKSLGVAASALDTNVAMVTFMPPAVESERGRDTVIVLDCSGSMAGDSIHLAKEGVQLAIGHLTPEDRFGLIGFGSSYTELAPALLSADSRAVQRARRFVTDLGEMGGTELAEALMAALGYARGPLDILLLTDGEAWSLADVVEKAKAGDARIFTIGIGSAAAEDTVRNLADETGGACELVSPNEDMSARIERHFNRMRQPRIQEVAVAWPTTPLWETRPARASFAGDAYTVFAAFPSAVAGTVTANLRFADGEHLTTSVQLDTVEDLDSNIVRVAAASRLTRFAQSDKQEWAVRYQLATDDTDYIVTLARAAEERPKDLPELHVVPQMHPAGWGGMGTVMRSMARNYGDIGDFDGADFKVVEPMETEFSISIDALDVPAVMRSARRTLVTAIENYEVKGALADFVERIRRRLERRTQDVLPVTRDELVEAQLPAEFVVLVDEACAKGFPEVHVACALYQALLVHGVGDAIGKGFVTQTQKLIEAHPVDDIVLRKFNQEIYKWRRLGKLKIVSLYSCYDIPAFLRRQAD